MWNDSSKLAVLRAHLSNYDFNHNTEFTLRYWPGGKTEPSVKLLRQGPEMREEFFKKIIILDFDGVFNKPYTPSPAEIYLDYLIDNNLYLRQKKDRVVDNFRMLEKSDDPRPYCEGISFDFRIAELTRELHSKACEYAAENFSLVTNYSSALRDLRDMAYKPFILSASPEELIASSKNRTSIQMENVEATRFHFDSHDIFQSMELNLDDTRATKRDKIMEQSISTKYGVEIMVDDNPKTGKRIVKSGWNHVYFWANTAPILPDNINIESLELRHDFSKIIGKLKKLERGLAVTITMDEKDYKNAIELAYSAMEYGNYADRLSGLEFKENKDKVVRSLRKYIEQMGGIFPSKQTGIPLDLKSVEIETNERVAKSKLKRLMNKFFENSLETKIPRNLISVA